MTKVALIIGHPTLLSRYQGALHFQPGISCTVAAKSVQEFYELLPSRSAISILVVDDSLPENTDMEMIAELRKRFPQANILVLVQRENGDRLISAIQNGANGFVQHPPSEFDLPEMIRNFVKDGTLLAPSMVRHLVEYFHNLPQKSSGLTPAEQRLLQLFYEGLTYQQCAQQLGITVDGVKYYVKMAYRKLGVNKKIDALRIFREQSS